MTRKIKTKSRLHKFAVCLCKAGLSGTCGHVSAVLHQLIEWSQRNKQMDSSLRCEKTIDINDNTPCTSKQNTWKPPKKKSVLPKTCIADYTFHKNLSVWEIQPTKRKQKRDYKTFNSDPSLTEDKITSHVQDAILISYNCQTEFAVYKQYCN
ncbi:unnamed protein product [Mytilus coruscus]|uniref:SWIM-type domain-containing protein n=1 Tax=Mytilus coruscus TaxID=42192 RepID=A0A6J8C1V2_MYTCO|nr:unnamed protein product [Mytilus coruscus]